MRKRPVVIIRSVSSMSATEGFMVPLGWLCTSISFAAHNAGKDAHCVQGMVVPKKSYL